jgi:type IV pilus assembly protein PilA
MRRLRRKLAAERGLTLTEILVVLLMIGILAAIMLPAWMDQRAKGEDTEAKLTIRTTAIALIAYADEHGTFDATVPELVAIEPSLADTIDLRVQGDADSFEVRERSAATTEFWMRQTDGRVTRDCSNHGHGLCRDAPDARGNHW